MRLMVVMVDQEVLSPQRNLPLINVKLLLQIHIGKEEKQDMMDLEVPVEMLRQAKVLKRTEQVALMEEVAVELFG